jgi:hypothetical protein
MKTVAEERKDLQYPSYRIRQITLNRQQKYFYDFMAVSTKFLLTAYSMINGEHTSILRPII